MLDPFRNLDDSAAAPARRAFPVTPHDANELPLLPKALLIGAGGTVALRAIDSVADVTITAVAGQIVPVRAQFVRATGTTAGAIVALA